MTNKNIFETINKVCNTNNAPYVVDPREVFQVAFHCFYFMKPSKQRDDFIEKLTYIFVDSLDEARAVKEKTSGTMVESMIYVASKRLLIELTENFDESYFKSQMDKVNPDIEYNKQVAIDCIQGFDKAKLYEYFELIGSQNFNGEHFMSREAFVAMWNELSDECAKNDVFFAGMKNAFIEEWEEDFEPVINFDKAHINTVTGEIHEQLKPLYFFEYLPVATIVRIFEKHIDGDMEMLAFATTVSCYSDMQTALDLTFAMCYLENNYSIYGLDLIKSRRSHDFTDSYLSFAVACANTMKTAYSQEN